MTNNEREKRYQERRSNSRAVEREKEYQRRKRYKNVDSSMVNQAYMDSFFKDADSYIKSAEGDYGKIGWGESVNANSFGLANDLYNSKSNAWNDLSSRADAVGAWLYKNRNFLSPDAYTYYNEYLDSFYEGGKGILDSFKDTMEAYNNTWENQDEYAKWYQGGYYGLRDIAKSDVDFLKYADLGKQERNAVNNAQQYETFHKILERLGLYSNYHTMTDDEVNIYNYFVGKGEIENAEKYLSKLSEYKLKPETGKRMANAVSGDKGLELIFAAVAGLNQFEYGLKNFDNLSQGLEAEETPTIQYAIPHVRENMTGGWGIAYDLAQTTANMLPSIMVGALDPAAGTLTMGASSAGNAYAQMRNLGYDEDQSRAYGLLVGASEATLQYFLGGISKLGGKVSNHAIKNLVSKVDDVVAKAAISLGGKMASEGTEEAIQTMLEPAIKALVTGEEFESPEWEDVLYSGLLGALSAGTLEGAPTIAPAISSNIRLNKEISALKKNPEALKTMLETIAMENPDVDVSKLLNKINEGKNISNGKLKKALVANERSIWNKDYNSLVDATESRLTELGEQGDVRKLAESIVRAQYGYNFDEALELSKSQIANNKELGLKDLSYLMAEYSQNAPNKQSLSRAEQKAIRDSEYGRRVSNELNPNMRDETSSAWAQGVKTNRLGNTAENVAKTRAALTQLNEASKSQKKLPSNAISYKSGAVDATLTQKGRDAKIEGENKSISETYARAEGYKGLANETFSKYYKGENIEEYALGFREAYDYGLNGTVKDIKDLANHGSFKSYINEEAREMAFNAGVVDAKYMGIKSKTIKVDGDYKVTVPMSNKALSESKQATIELMKVLAPIAKVNMSTMVSLKDHGLYDPKTNTIYIDLAMDGRDVMIFTLSHELTHHLKRVNPEQFDEFARVLFEEVGKTENVEERLAKWMRENKKYYPNMPQAEFKALAREEVVAEMCESFLTDEKVVQRISQKVYETDKGLWNTIKKWFENLVAKLKKLFADLDPQSENGRIVREMGDRLDSVRQMWADMVIEAGTITTEATQEQVKNSRKDLEKLDADYLSAVERGDMETAQRMVDEVANATMPDSKIRTEDGKLRVVYHGTNTGDFTVFNPDYIGMSSGDDGFFGMGFYFAYSKGEASYYGSSRVIPAYLNLKNPFNFEKELQSYQGKRASGGYAPDAVALMNFADKFPEIAKNVKIGVVENESDTVEDISLVEFSKAFKDVIENKTFEYREVENEFGEKETVVTADAKTVEYQYDGKKYSYTDYGFQKRFWGTPNELDVAYEYLANSVYEYVDMIPRTRLILDNNREFTDALKDMGYDGTIQSEYGDEAVAFYPNQIKSADPVTYDDKGKVIPLSQRFNAENDDIRYSRKPFAEQVDDVLNGMDTNSTHLKIMETPKLLQEAGLPNLPILMTAKHLKTITQEKGKDRANYHGLGVDIIKNLPKYINDPVMIADSLTRDDSVVIITEALDKEKRPVIAAIMLNGKGTLDSEYIDANIMTSAYGRNNFQNFINSIANNSAVIYWNKNKSQELSVNLGLQLPNIITRLDSDTIIRKAKAFVNTNLKNSENFQEEMVHSRKTVDPITSREQLAKALSRVAKGEDRAIVESYKANVNLIKGETARLESLRKEIDEIKYKKSITYEGRELSVKEFEQLAYTKAYDMGIDAENVKFKALKESGKYIATVDGKKLLEADKRFRSKDDIDKLATLEQNYQATIKRIATYDKKLLQIEAMSSIKQLINREKKASYDKAKAEGKEALKEYKAQAIAEQKKITERYQEMRKKNVEGRKTTEMRHKLMNTVHTLDQLLVNPTKKKHIPIGLQKPVAEALNILNTDTVGAEERLAKITAELKTTDGPVEIERLLERYNRIKAQGDKIKEKIDSLKSAYAEILNSEDDIIRNSYDEVIANTIEQVSSKIGDTAVRDMTYDQLEMLYKMYRMILKTIRDANKSFTMAKGEEISTLGQNVMSEAAQYERKDKAVLPLFEKGLQFTWNNLKPVYAFERIGSSTLAELYNNVRRGEDVWAVDMQEARAYSDAQKAKYGYKSWDMEKTYTFHTPLGKEFKLNLGQIMSIYAYTRRGEQAIEHLINGGFVYDGVTIVEKKIGDKIKVDAELKDSTAYRLDEAVIGQINATLTKDQREFAEAMQKYLSETMGEKGNEVSLALYDIKIFGEKNYFPLKSSQVFLERAREQARGEVKIKNKGFTKETTPRANNPITLTSFMDVWADHCIEMSMYHAFTLPLEDFYRVYNYKERATDEKDTESVIMNLENAYGKSVTSYIDQLLVDLNGGLRTDPRAGILGGTIAAFKKASTMASLSVVVQQPSSIIRAMSMVDAKYFIDKSSKYTHKQTWEEVKKYAPVAVIKEMGYFDVGLGKTSQEWLKNDPTKYEQFEEKWLTRAPALADEMGWNILWKAIKRETVAKHPELKFNSEEFLNECGRRFTEVVSMTQVYDSVFSRSANMRSKDTGMKMLTSFMAESTTISNMFEDAMLKARRGNKKVLGKTIGAIVFSSLVNAIAVSFVYAARDDDDEEYWNKYLKKFVDNFGSNIIPVAWIPIGRDFMSLIEGYDIERADMSLLSDLVKAIRRLSSTRVEAEEKIADIIGAIANLFGIPLKNLYRDFVEPIWRHFTK